MERKLRGQVQFFGLARAGRCPRVIVPEFRPEGSAISSEAMSNKVLNPALQPRTLSDTAA